MCWFQLYAFSHIVKEKDFMGKIIIDGKSVYEIDEDCVKRKRVPTECDVLDKLKKDWKNDVLLKEDKKKTKNV